MSNNMAGKIVVWGQRVGRVGIRVGGQTKISR